ncbi:MFS transporter [Pseudolysinimonas sp.]|uniref:MFS transporter n=1 Tax=Pseudolysinimonas sp. TaxID=2680009 RepID=UPI003F7D5C0C
MAARILERWTAADPVLRILAITTLIATLGRGIFLPMTTLYLSFVVHLPAAQIALVLAAGSITSIVSSVIGGHLADRFSARRLSFVGLVVASVGLISYAAVSELVWALVVAVVESAALGIGFSARGAIIGRAFDGEQRVRTRAIMQTITNVGIGVGTTVAAIPLAIGTPEAYRLSFAIAGVVVLLGQLPLLRLPVRVDAAAAHGAAEPQSETPPVIEGDDPAPELIGEAAGRPSRDPVGGRPPWKNPRYLLLAGLSGVFAVQFAVQEMGLPLWIAHDTTAPRWIISVLLVLNTVIVVLFTVRLSKGSHRLRTAGRLSALAGGLMAVACVVYALAAGVPVLLACVILILASLVHAFAEVLSQAGGWGLSFELADQRRIGAYQGVFGTSFAMGSAVGPALITVTAIALGMPGWLILAAVFLLSALGITVIAERAARRDPAAA